MNIFKSVYAYLYNARIKEGYEASGSPLTANIVLSCCITLLIVSFFLMIYLIIPDVANSIDEILKDMFGRRTGKSIGRVLGIALILIIFPIIKFTIGSDENYKKTLDEFNALDDAEKEKVTKKGMIFSSICFASIFVPILIGLVFK